jgi:hypothetical protein
VFVGTLYPLALEALTGDKISVGAPFFNLTFAPLIVPLLVAVPFGPLLAWKRGDLLAAAQRLMAAACLALAAIVLVLAFRQRGPWLAPLGIGLGVWLIAGAATELVYRVKLFEASAIGGSAQAAQSASLCFRNSARSCRPRHCGDRHRRYHCVALRSNPRDEAWPDGRALPATRSPSKASRRVRARITASAWRCSRSRATARK